MALFSSSKKEDKISSGKYDFPANDKDYLNSTSLIASNTKIQGTIRCQGNMRIDGELHGDIFCEKKLIIGQAGVVYGNISSKFLDLEGKIYGDIKINMGLKLRDKSFLKGNIDLYSGSLEIEDGAIFNGSVEMKKQEGANNADTNHQISNSSAPEKNPTLTSEKKI